MIFLQLSVGLVGFVALVAFVLFVGFACVARAGYERIES